MAEREWTPQQQTVIDDRGNNLIVSAAAGSGKTAVLVERVIKKITDEKNPADVDRLLVVTFTKAAAAEMKERLRAAIEARLEKNPDDEHMRRQQLLLTNSYITTIDSFCLRVIRNYYQTADIDPSFRVMGDEEKKLMVSDVLADVLEEHFKNLDDPFLRLVERYETPKKGGVIAEMVKKLYDAAESMPWPEEWLEDCKKLYEVRNTAELEQSRFFTELTDNIDKVIASCHKMASHCLRIANAPGGPLCYTEALESDVEFLSELRRKKEFDERYRLLRDWKAERLPSKKSSGEEESMIREEIKGQRDIYKKAPAKIKEKFFERPLAGHLDDVIANSEPAHVLIGLTIEFIRKLAERKNRNGVIDFGDMEHNVLKILLNGKGEDAELTESAKELKASFDEIMIDEYQDSNHIQELILTSIAGKDGDGPTLFTVGDVKQSIYSFRMARPELFTRRYKRFLAGDGGKAIDLDRNFRSRASVLDSVNSLFAKIMHSDIGGVEYDEKAMLKVGSDYADNPATKSEICLVELSDEEEDDEISSKAVEATVIGTKIREYVSDGGLMLYEREKKEFRKCRYGDIVILMRAMNNRSGEYAQVLSRMGIPVVADVTTGFFETMEVQTVLNYLRILDNPLQDIPFAAVLHSAIGGIDNDGMAVIKARGKKNSSFYEAAREYAESGLDEKLKAGLTVFFETYDELRSKASEDLAVLVREVCEKTGFLYYVAALEGSETRRGNLKFLEDKAVSFAGTSYHGLFDFLRYIEKLEKHELDYGEAVSAASVDAVRIMTIHKSKGLEFPVVFLADTGKKINKSDAYKELIVHPDFGVAANRINLDMRIKYPTLLHNGFARFVENATIGEELRVLYVAMTRAKEKLVITAVGKNFKQNEGRGPEYIELEKASKYIDLILPAADERFFEISRIPSAYVHAPREENGGEGIRSGNDAAGAAEGTDENIAAGSAGFIEKSEDKDLRDFFEGGFLKDLAELRAYDYSSKDPELPVKITVSEMKRRHGEELFALFEDTDGIVNEIDGDGLSASGEGMQPETDGEGLPAQEEDIRPETAEDGGPAFGEDLSSNVDEEKFPVARTIPLPVFMGGEKAENEGAALGTLVHLLLQHFPYGEGEDVGAYLDAMEEKGMISDSERRRIPEGWLPGFLAGELAGRMRRACAEGKLKREQPFMYEVNASAASPGYEGHKTVIVQGMIDAFFEEDGELILVDYKTDRCRDGKVLVERYRFQLDTYADALARITGKRVREKIIYSFALGKEILL